MTGIYIHIPFCLSRCSYCDFATGAYESALAERYVSAVIQEIARFSTDATADTIYFGGGTPSLLAAGQLAKLLEALRGRFDVVEEAEVTIEMNPGTVTPSILREFLHLGINRASFGAQTFDDRELRRLGRAHSAEDTRRTFSDLRGAGFENISFDLIAGLPGQTIEGWSRNLDEALRLGPEHLSLYLLEVHEGTPLANHIRQGLQPQPDDDVAASMYRVMVERTAEAGYEHYEISNFCLPGRQSRHNSKYWSGEPVYGFGCSAHSYDGGRRRWSNNRDTRLFVEAVEEGRSPVVENIELSERDAEAEAVFLGLRLMRGVSLSKHHSRFGRDLRAEYGKELGRLREAGLVLVDSDEIRLTVSGALLSNEVFSVFI
jgi:oxygen-independent coproporphyrinogen-3 oxidase